MIGSAAGIVFRATEITERKRRDLWAAAPPRPSRIRAKNLNYLGKLVFIQGIWGDRQCEQWRGSPPTG